MFVIQNSIRGEFWASWVKILSSVSKSNRLYVDILRFFFTNLRYILYIPLKWWVVFLKSWWTSTTYFSNSTSSSVTSSSHTPGWQIWLGQTLTLFKKNLQSHSTKRSWKYATGKRIIRFSSSWPEVDQNVSQSPHYYFGQEISNCKYKECWRGVIIVTIA